MLVIEIFVKNYPPTVYLNGYPNIASSIPDFSLAKNRRRE
jgi:hypothetical protein